MNSYLEAVPGLWWNRYSLLMRPRSVGAYLYWGGDPAIEAEFRQADRTCLLLAAVGVVGCAVFLLFLRVHRVWIEGRGW